MASPGGGRAGVERSFEKGMDSFLAYRLDFLCEAVTAIEMPLNKGSMLRGAFFEALRRDFCLNKAVTSCLSCPTADVCPICRLVATVDRESSRGAEVPRPFTLQPIMSNVLRYDEGTDFSFGITLFGQALSLFPYVVLAVQRMGELGLGRRDVAPGRFRLNEVWTSNPLTGARKRLYSHHDRMVAVPDIPITHQDVLRHCAGLSQRQISLELLTPVRLVSNGALVHQLDFAPLMRRLLRRLTELYQHFCGERLEADFPALLDGAEKVRLTRDSTHWRDLSSYSRRRQARTPIGGLVGEVIFEGELGPFLPYLVWGQFTHVGKDATRGNGWYRVRDEGEGERVEGEGRNVEGEWGQAIVS